MTEIVDSLPIAERANKDEFRHMPQLDSLRALAVFSVFIEHYIKIDDPVRAALPWGTLGVRLFFVLSGFLITGILYRCRAQIDRGEGSLAGILRAFFTRRFLRLMPVYYLYLASAVFLLPSVRPHLWAFALYLQNFLFAAKPEVFSVLLAHFWTLAVEEQFYLTWPLIVLLVPRKRLPYVMAGIVVLGPLLRAVGLLGGLTPHQIRMMMPAHFDTLGLGGLFAVLAAGSPAEMLWAKRLASAGLWLGLPLSVVAFVAARLHFATVEILMDEGATGLFFLWVVAGAAVGGGGVAGSVLNSRGLQFIGKISYGIYVYHFNVPGLVRERLAPRLGLTLSNHPWVNLLLFGSVAILIAAASWQFFEQPINRLKRRFDYRSVGRTIPAA
jgi:peptidoglycan/LPS O-acetylase OafA/YrhL